MVKVVDAHVVLAAFVADYETQSQAAAALGVSGTFLSDLLAKKRDCSEKILDQLGLQRAVIAKGRS